MKKIACFGTIVLTACLSLTTVFSGVQPVFAAGVPTIVSAEAAVLPEAGDEAVSNDVPNNKADNGDVICNEAASDEAVNNEAVLAVGPSMSGNCGVLTDNSEVTGNLTYEIVGDTLYIHGKGEMGDMRADANVCHWRGLEDHIRHIHFDEGVTSIGAKAFYRCNNLTSVTIPSTIQKINAQAFWNCENLKEVHIHAKLVGEGAFQDCASLEQVHIGREITAVGVSAFENCPNIRGVYIEDLAQWCSIHFGGNMANPLEQNANKARTVGEFIRFYLNGSEVINLDIPHGVTKIEDFAFFCGMKFETVNIPSSVTEIGEYAFCQNKSLKRVTGASSVTTIGARAFQSNGKFSQMPFSDALTYVGAYAFEGAPIQSFAMNSGEIGKYAFEHCGALGNIRVGKDVKIHEGAFNGCATVVPSNYTDTRQTVKIGHMAGRTEPLEWIVLDVTDGEALVMSKNILAFHMYYFNAHTARQRMGWSGSALKQWCDELYANAFSASEKANILTTTVPDDDMNPLFHTHGGSSSESTVYILSASELDRYFRNSEDRMASRLPYVPTTKSSQEDNDLHASYYWARTPGMFDYQQTYVNYTGDILYTGMNKDNTDAGVRPVMRVNAAYFGIKDTEAQIKAFVTRLYQLCLEREPDVSGLNGWTNSLKNKEASAAKVVANFFKSREMAQLNLSDSEFLDRCYKVLMDRDADSSGKAAWQSYLDQGYSRLYILSKFVKSVEFTNICANYGVERGQVDLPSEDQNPFVTAYVKRCYKEVLGRDADRDGLRNWTGSILNAPNRKEKARDTAKNGFLNSKEFLNKNLDNTAFCKVLYRVFLDRDADEGGLAYWVARLDHGENRNTVIDGFAYSVEFNGLLAKFNL